MRGEEGWGECVPEDWVGSVTTVHGAAEEGQSRLADSTLLADLIAGDPDAYLGPGRSELRLLVKLLDAGQRLPVHLHPDTAFARARLGAPCGKTEAWFVISAEGPDPCVWLGLSQAVDDATLRGWVEDQAIEELLGALNRVPVRDGDAIFVPAGELHAIGEGVLICELQEPSDLSVLLEWRGFELDGGDPYLGLGLEGALEAIRREPLSAEELSRLGGGRDAGRDGAERLLPPDADAFFGLERTRVPGVASLPRGPSILVVLDGEGRLVTGEGGLTLRRGVTALVPWAAGEGRLEGDLDVLRCMPADEPS